MSTYLKLPRLSDEEIRNLARENALRGKPLSLLLDIVFKDAFSSDNEDSRRALKSLLSACTRKEIRDAKVLNSELLPLNMAGKTIRMDIHTGFNNGERADLEMQMRIGPDDQKARGSLYGAKLLAGQGRRGERYRRLKQVYQVFFINGILFPGSGKLPRRYTMMEEGEHDRLNELEEIVFYELPKLAGPVRKYLKKELALEILSPETWWCIYLRNRGKGGMESMVKELSRLDEGIMSVERVLERMSRDEEEWARALSRELGEMDYWSGLGAAEEKGIAIGEQRGITIGKQRGIAIGEQRGREQEAQKAYREKLEQAQKMKTDGLTLEQIEKYSGLSRGEIEGPHP
jgi:predicted transposase/invertase (TIGR01784 family)